jgi:hypothetical protein
MENYLIDRRLKSGKDYPGDLDFLLHLFNGGKPLINLNSKRGTSNFEKNVSLIERTFIDYFLNPSKKNECIRRVNAKLKLVNPSLQPNGKGGYDLERETIWSSNSAKRDRHTGGQVIDCWLRLAKVLSRVDPKLFHRCLECRNYFFSRQRKDYHPECKPKFFSEKYKKNGRQKGWEKESRKRKRGQLAKTR